MESRGSSGAIPRDTSAIERRKRKHIEDGEDNIEDDCVLEIFGNPLNDVDGRYRSSENQAQARIASAMFVAGPAAATQDHVTTRIMKGAKVHRHRLGVSEQKR
jgi:hypothetical protein